MKTKQNMYFRIKSTVLFNINTVLEALFANVFGMGSHVSQTLFFPTELYLKGLVYLDVPIEDDDYISGKMTFG